LENTLEIIKPDPTCDEMTNFKKQYEAIPKQRDGAAGD